MRASTTGRLPGSGVRRAALAVVIVLIGAITLATRQLLEPEGPAGPLREEPSVGPPTPAFAKGWTKLPLPPQTRDGASYVWTGSALLAWGGCDPAVSDRCSRTADGFALDPRAGMWRPIPAAPIPGSYAHALWTGSEALFLGLSGHGDRLDGEAFDPSTGRWRTVSTAPIGDRHGSLTAWTGTDVFVWGGGRPNSPAVTSGAMYDPARDSWRRISRAPHGMNLGTAVWTGREILVFGSLLDTRNHADTRTSIAMAYDPSTDRWTQLPPSSLSPQATSAEWLDGRLVAWDYETHWQALDPTTDTWSERGRMPLQPSECYPDSALVGVREFAFFCGTAALFDPSSDAWSRVHGGPLSATIYSKAYKTSIELWRFADLIPAGDVLIMPAEGITLSKRGEACYGCQGSPHSLWAYRPL